MFPSVYLAGSILLHVVAVTYQVINHDSAHNSGNTLVSRTVLQRPGERSSRPCPCENHTLCEPVRAADRRETTHRCAIKPVPFHGVLCSDAVGSQIGYGGILKDFLPLSTTGKLWDETARSPYFIFKDKKTGDTYSLWYDDPQSLEIKYTMAVRLGLRGVGMWNADLLDYGDKSQVDDMWGQIPG